MLAVADVVTCPLLSVFKVLITAYRQLRWVTELRDVFAKAVSVAGFLQTWAAGRGHLENHHGQGSCGSVVASLLWYCGQCQF